MSHELYKAYRPTSFKGVLGQGSVCKTLASQCKAGKLPHALLLVGPSGVGKTTIARIIARRLKAKGSDLIEQNAAEMRGIDSIRDIKGRLGYVGIKGGCRVFIVDECHQLTKDAQNALLKMLEDCPDHVYFVLCTTDPQKIIATVKNRCTKHELKLVSGELLTELVENVLEAEGDEVEWPEGEVVEALVEAAEGSPRKALVLLESVLALEGSEAQLEALTREQEQRQAIELARMLCFARTTWPKVAALLTELKGEDPESLRRMMLGYCAAVVLKGGKPAPKCASLLAQFSSNYFDTGWSGLVLDCYELFHEG